MKAHSHLRIPIASVLAALALAQILTNPAKAASFTSSGSLATARYFHSATLLSNGKVLVAGGAGLSTSVQSSAELYDPSTGTWSATGSMITGRYQHTATMLPNGKVLIAGGEDASLTPISS